MNLVRRLVLSAVLLVIASFVVLHQIAAQSETEIVGAFLVVLLLAVAIALAIGLLYTGRLAELANAVRNMALGTAPRLPKVGVPEIDALGEALRQMHSDVAAKVDALQTEQRDTTAIIEAMLEGVIAADSRGRITIANPAARRLLGYPQHSELPLLSALFRSKNARSAVDEVLAGEVVHDRELDIDELTLLLNARPLADKGAVLVLHDLTEIRRLELIRRDFIANASHELKTPLTSIVGYIETLLGDPDMDPTNRQRFIGTIDANARRMQQLVDDLLDLSKVESGRWNATSEPIELGTLISECWALLNGKATARKIDLNLQLAPDAETMVADPETLRQIFGNLFDNAIRHVAVGGKVIARTSRSDGGILLSVEDNGSGIAPEHLPRIFERFYRVDASRSRDEGGTGLGLSIVKHLIETQGGRIWAESALRVGTTIYCWFPLP